MRKCTPTGSTDVPAEGRGQACTLIVNQPSTDAGGWTIDIEAQFGDDRRPCWVTRVTLQPVTAALGRTCMRVVAAIALPQAVTYAAVVTPPSPAPAAPIEVGLKASDLTPFLLILEPVH
jgi:hypothetical protein